MRRFVLWVRDKRGTATVEFALASLFMFGIIVVALDFAYAAQQQLKLGSAVQQAAIIAYNQQTGSNTAAISNYVIAAAGTQAAPSVAITCNGTTTCGDGKCSCITSSGTFAIAGSCNATCTGSSAISGNYLKVVATLTYVPVIVPDQFLRGKTMTSSAVVRLQ